MRVPDELRPTADDQLGLLTRRQLKHVGVTTDQLRWAHGRTTRLVLPGVLALFTGELSPRQRLIAASLYAGAEAHLSGLSALRWLGIGETPYDGVFRFLVPAHRNVRSSGFVVVRRTTRPDPRPWPRDQLLVCSPARAVVDGARELRHPDLVRSLVIGAVQRRQVTVGGLLAEVEAGAIRGSAAVRRAVNDAGTGAWSLPEADVLAACAESRVLPRIWPNPELFAADGTRLPSPDGWIDEVGLGIQVHSREFHLRDADWDGTVQRDTLLGSYGIAVIAVTPRSFGSDPAAFVGRVERAYLELRRLDRRPDVLMRPRGPGVLPAA
jgi:hypothetical protein